MSGHLPLASSRAAVVLPLLRDAAVPVPSDQDLVERALLGEALALQGLYLRHVRAVTERVTRLLSRSGEAEDALERPFGRERAERSSTTRVGERVAARARRKGASVFVAAQVFTQA